MPITFAEWGYLGKGRFQRCDFRFDMLTGSSKFSEEGSLWADQGKHQIFTPIKTYPPMKVHELALCWVVSSPNRDTRFNELRMPFRESWRGSARRPRAAYASCA
jgi:hypothetical protein